MSSMAALLMALPAATAGQTGDLEAVSFMAGTWCSEGAPGATIIEEHYTTPSTNLVLGTTRYLRDGVTVGHELTRMEADSSGVVLTPMPSGQAPVPFRLTRAEPGHVVFENPEHDFPVRIEYQRVGAGLVARALGPDGQGPQWHMQPCPPPRPSEEPRNPAAGVDGSAMFQRLAGDWEGSGTLFDSTARFTMRWDVADGLASLRFANAVVDETGSMTPILTAAAVYRTLGTPEGTWLDTRGERLILSWTTEDGALVVRWRGEEESGRTTYRPTGPDTLEVLDEVTGSEGWRVFGRARYARVLPPPSPP